MTNKNPLIDDLVESSVIPTIEIALPTRGQFYPDGEVLAVGADPDKLVINPISVLEESSFNDPLMMITGHAIGKMISRVCRDIVEPQNICDVDVQAILVASRIVSHGPKMAIEHTCDSCNKKNDMEVDLDSHILNFGSYTPEDIMNFTVELDVIGQTAHLRPMRYQDTVDMTMNLVRANSLVEDVSDADASALSEDFVRKYRDRFEKNLDTNIKAMAASIYYVTTRSGVRVFDEDLILDWVNSLPSENVNQITERIKEINEDIRERSLLEYQCQHCNKKGSFYLELDAQKLFSPAGISEAPKKSSAKQTSTEKSTKKTSKSSARLY